MDASSPPRVGTPSPVDIGAAPTAGEQTGLAVWGETSPPSPEPEAFESTDGRSQATIPEKTTSVISSGEAVAIWLDAFREPMREELFMHIHAGVPALFLEHPRLGLLSRSLDDLAHNDIDLLLSTAQQAMREALPVFDTPRKLPRIRLTHLPELYRVKLRDLRTDHVGRLFAFDGIIRKVTSVREILHVGVFQCQQCMQKIRHAQDPSSDAVEFPAACEPTQNGCGKPASRCKFKLLTDESEFGNVQMLELQEDPEGLGYAAMPEAREVALYDDLCNSIQAGAHVTVNGITRRVASYGPTGRRRVHNSRIEALSVEMRQAEEKESKPTPEELDAFRAMAAQPDVLTKLVASFATAIHGRDEVKRAILLQVAGGVEWKDRKSGSRKRGDIHILMYGDPSTAKSALLSEAHKLHSRSIKTSGMGSSAAGLTATVTHDEFTGRWTLEAGAGVLADRGQLCCDEFEKMRPADRGAIHPMMEQGEVSINKAGVSATLNARVAVLAAANPKEGRFNLEDPPASQLDLDPPLLTRFDLMFAMKDDHQFDEQISEHILDFGEDSSNPPLSLEMLRKYLTYVRTHFKPKLTKAAKVRLKEQYLEMRRRGNGVDAPVQVTTRQLEALIRLSTASAKIRMSTMVEQVDTDVAVDLYGLFLKTSAFDGGRSDIDLLFTGFSKNQRDTIADARSVIKELGEVGDFTADQFLEAMRARQHDEKHASTALDALVKGNEVFSPRPNTLRPT